MNSTFASMCSAGNISSFYSAGRVNAVGHAEHHKEKNRDINKGSKKVLIVDPVFNRLGGILKINGERLDKLLTEVLALTGRIRLKTAGLLGITSGLLLKTARLLRITAGLLRITAGLLLRKASCRLLLLRKTSRRLLLLRIACRLLLPESVLRFLTLD